MGSRGLEKSGMQRIAQTSWINERSRLSRIRGKHRREKVSGAAKRIIWINSIDLDGIPDKMYKELFR